MSSNSSLTINTFHYADNIQEYELDFFNGKLKLYPGPEFQTLDEKFQQELLIFIKQLGIDDDLCSFIDVISIDKEQRLYSNYLKKLNNFI